MPIYLLYGPLWLPSSLNICAKFFCIVNANFGSPSGAFVNGPIADRISRRWDLLLANVVFQVGSILQASAMNVPMIFVGRFIAGLAIGQLSMVVPLYLGELAPPNIRGSLIALQQLGITVGIMVAFW